MAAAMDTLIQSPVIRLAMGRAARARVLDRFTTASLREQFTQWYREVTDDNRLGGRVETGDGRSGRAARASRLTRGG